MSDNIIKHELKIFNLPVKHFTGFAFVVIIAVMMGVLPGGMAGCFAFMMIFGAILQEIGDRLPIVRSFL